MGVKRKTYRFRKGAIIDIEEFHDGNYGAAGEKREKKKKPTEEQMRAVNARNKMLRCRRRMLQYFNPGDIFATLTYEVKNRPPTMKDALEDFQRFIRCIRRGYKKAGHELFWIRNIERGTKGAWHIHLVINRIEETADLLLKHWTKGGVYNIEIRNNSTIYDEDFTKLSAYMTKDEHTVEKKLDGELSKPRIRESNYGTSRNMPLPEPEVDKLVLWKKVPHTKKGYYISSYYEGINPVTGFSYRRYTMIRQGYERSGG